MHDGQQLLLEELLGDIRLLREDVNRQEQLLKRIIAHIGISATEAWVPIRDGEAQKTNFKITKIEAEESEDIVTRLRNTWLGKIYKDKLKGYQFVRWFVGVLWRNGYPLYSNLISIFPFGSKARRWRKIIRLNDYVKKFESPVCLLADAAVVETPAPTVFPTSDQSYLVSPHDNYSFPEVYVAAVNLATVYGGTNLIQVDGVVVCHDLYDFERDFTSEELHGRALIDPKQNRIRWLLNDKSPAVVAEAAVFIDSCASNYAHWMTEVLPRIALFCADERFKHIALIINDGLHENIMESLSQVAGVEREIITLGIGRALTVNTLLVTSVVGYVPFERRTKKLSEHSHGLFSPWGFELIRNRLCLQPEGQDEMWPEKIYLRRNSGARKVTNASEIEKLLVGHGYVVVEPEKLTYLEQSKLFSRAKVVVGSSGAALANIIFCPPSAQIYIFISKYPGTSYWYWQNMAAASGKTVQYFFGEAVSGDIQGIHDDFRICKDEVTTALALRGVS